MVEMGSCLVFLQMSTFLGGKPRSLQYGTACRENILVSSLILAWTILAVYPLSVFVGSSSPSLYVQCPGLWFLISFLLSRPTPPLPHVISSGLRALNAASLMMIPLFTPDLQVRLPAHGPLACQRGISSLMCPKLLIYPLLLRSRLPVLPAARPEVILDVLCLQSTTKTFQLLPQNVSRIQQLLTTSTTQPCPKLPSSLLSYLW